MQTTLILQSIDISPQRFALKLIHLCTSLNLTGTSPINPSSHIPHVKLSRLYAHHSIRPILERYTNMSYPGREPHPSPQWISSPSRRLKHNGQNCAERDEDYHGCKAEFVLRVVPRRYDAHRNPDMMKSCSVGRSIDGCYGVSGTLAPLLMQKLQAISFRTNTQNTTWHHPWLKRSLDSTWVGPGLVLSRETSCNFSLY